ncbi:MAG: Ryanodine receptor Ryr [Oscillospiraceae bacterium]|nr:Ryanodine receptor Ryr [Oscillospiraceae bacterium]
MKEPYIPAPADTSDVTVTAELFALSEKMARNTHEIWAAGRVAEGWHWGPVRDDVRKEHPCLVPYDELPESEKDYDRRTSMETLKLLLKLGCRITME